MFQLPNGRFGGCPYPLPLCCTQLMSEMNYSGRWPGAGRGIRIVFLPAVAPDMTAVNLR